MVKGSRQSLKTVKQLLRVGQSKVVDYVLIFSKLIHHIAKPHTL